MKSKEDRQNMGPLNTCDPSCSEPALVLSPVGRTPADFCVSNKTKPRQSLLGCLFVLCGLRLTGWTDISVSSYVIMHR